MKIRKISKPSPVVLSDLVAGDVFSRVDGSQEPPGPFMKVQEQTLRSGFKVQAINLPDGKMYGNFADDMPVTYFPLAELDLGVK